MSGTDDRSEFIRQEVEKRLVSGIFQVRVERDAYGYEIIISDGYASTAYKVSNYELDMPNFQNLFDKIVANLVQLYAYERFLKK